MGFPGSCQGRSTPYSFVSEGVLSEKSKVIKCPSAGAGLEKVARREECNATSLETDSGDPVFPVADPFPGDSTCLGGSEALLRPSPAGGGGVGGHGGHRPPPGDPGGGGRAAPGGGTPWMRRWRFSLL